jgi:hypothetical protein
MPLFHLDWVVCANGYRIEEREFHKRLGAVGPNRSGPHIVANSEHWEQNTPLKTPGLYRQLADCEESPEGVLGFINLHGFLHAQKSPAEPVADAIVMIRATKKFVEDIENQDWGSLEDSAFSVQILHRYIGGLVSGVLFQTHPYSEQLKLSHLNRPILTIRPANLAVALQVQAMEDASLGINLRNCKNPECPEYLGSNSHRPQAEYCSPKCQRHHSYLKRKAAKK